MTETTKKETKSTKKTKTTSKPSEAPKNTESISNENALAAAILTLAATIKEVGYLDFCQETDVKVDNDKMLEIQDTAQKETLEFFEYLSRWSKK